MGLTRILVNKGGNLNNVSKTNQVPLIQWVNSQNLNHVRTLLEMGADPNFQDKKLRTSLHHAVNMSNSQADASFEMEELLTNSGAKANISDKKKRTPIFYAFVKIA